MKKKFKPHCMYCGHRYTSARNYFKHSCDINLSSWKQIYQTSAHSHGQRKKDGTEKLVELKSKNKKK